jgi:REP element-mobilizing transposase RayT
MSMLNLPLAYFITFRTYGTWLHGDPRGSVHRRNRVHRTPFYPPMRGLVRAEKILLANEPVQLDAVRRRVVEGAVRSVCGYRAWVLHALAVRVEHVHVVLSTKPEISPERVMTSLKAWATRRMVEEGALPGGVQTWSRHGSTRYLWSPRGVETARRYVLEEQGGPLEAPAISRR